MKLKSCFGLRAMCASLAVAACHRAGLIAGAQMRASVESSRWILLYTKPRAEAWAEINLRKQGFATLLPLIRKRRGFGPLFPRYLFVRPEPGRLVTSLRSTLGVQYVVHCGDAPARVPGDVISEVRSRMDDNGVVKLDSHPAPDPLFAMAQRERVRTLLKLSQAGFRVVA